MQVGQFLEQLTAWGTRSADNGWHANAHCVGWAPQAFASSTAAATGPLRPSKGGAAASAGPVSDGSSRSDATAAPAALQSAGAPVRPSGLAQQMHHSTAANGSTVAQPRQQQPSAEQNRLHHHQCVADGKADDADSSAAQRTFECIHGFAVAPDSSTGHTKAHSADSKVPHDAQSFDRHGAKHSSVQRYTSEWVRARGSGEGVPLHLDGVGAMSC